MIALPSEIHLENFVVLQSRYKFIPPKKEKIDSKEVFKSYSIDIDFAHLNNENGSIQVFTKISVNECENPSPGYSLFVEGGALFSLDITSNLSEAEQKNLKYFSTVNILIGYLRNTLMSMSASSPMGPYLLPPININDLFKKKSDSK